MPNILAIETTTDVCSVALQIENNIFFRESSDTRSHARLILPWIKDLLKEGNIGLADLDVIALSAGPGSFTGVRIGFSVAQGLAYGQCKKIISISTLQVLAQGGYRCFGAQRIFSCLDARMQEVYHGMYKWNKNNGLMESIREERIDKPEQVKIQSPILGVGTGCIAYLSVWKDHSPYLDISNEFLYPSARDILPIAMNKFLEQEYLLPEHVVPSYIRNNITKIKDRSSEK